MTKETPTSVRFDAAAKKRLADMSKRTKIPVKTLIEMGVDWFLSEVERGNAIPLQGSGAQLQPEQEQHQLAAAEDPAPYGDKSTSFLPKIEQVVAKKDAGSQTPAADRK